MVDERRGDALRINACHLHLFVLLSTKISGLGFQNVLEIMIYTFSMEPLIYKSLALDYNGIILKWFITFALLIYVKLPMMFAIKSIGNNLCISRVKLHISLDECCLGWGHVALGWDVVVMVGRAKDWCGILEKISTKLGDSHIVLVFLV